MKTKIIIIVLAILLAISNLYWIINNNKTNNYKIYAESHICEMHELIYCFRTFPLGISLEEFTIKINKTGMKIKEKTFIYNKTVIKLELAKSNCPKSGKQYCYIYFEFDCNKLVDINLDYFVIK